MTLTWLLAVFCRYQVVPVGLRHVVFANLIGLISVGAKKRNNLEVKEIPLVGVYLGAGSGSA